ncbi:NO-inducible flavohemoprotein [Salimicrobium salexigens]|uniref:Flavohemoprotein n=1 Tax=Salimicrobium salexigens TaxID=908941 RepID=A0ABY1KRK0_9BACI|nr:NO-inducible flavohemoprotein [Salimicrobium salexigens]SIS69190.1 nitric oxide dioxygenase [Salimicrobium salexigens]
MATQVTSRLDERTREIVKATVPVLAEHGEAITTHFYKRMLTERPELKNYFNMTHQKDGKQPRALANAVYAAASHIDDLSAIAPAAETIAEKHVSLNIRPEHYPIIGEYLLKAIKEVLGDAVDEEVIDAWELAYGEIADLFISIEDGKYKASAWTGYRLFTIHKKVKESEEITSFYLKPEDGGSLPSYRPGQYIGIKADIPDYPHTQRRQYSLSDAPGKDYLRISVKREGGTEEIPAGLVSTWLHDQVQEGDVVPISAPAGDFYLNESTSRPVVLLSGGVGLTPLMSMYKKTRDERDVYFIHAARNGGVHGLKEEMDGEQTYVVYETPSEEDKTLAAYDKAGYVDLDWLRNVVPKEADFYFCGPEGFMRAMNGALHEWGIPDEQVNYEFFGPKGTL